ncbi:MAG: Crp/Fnr family transcriptional regulator [Balneolaceae bacterium]|nr:MAG: Crp/Fnr family transcriptional regulator [Balneolaceae bacterium]
MKDNHKPIRPLLEYFDRVISLTDDEKELVRTKFKPHLYLKRQFVLQHGNICKTFNFVVRGCLRLYKVSSDGTYHVLQFANENHWILDLTSFHKHKPALFNIDALEDTQVLRISYDDLIDLYIKAPKFDRIFRVLLENHFMQQQERLAQLVSFTAEERYEAFLNTYPDLQDRLPQVQIAAYIGVTPEFLSRIRKRLAENNG